jgi:excisionase family DNA binding protein
MPAPKLSLADVRDKATLTVEETAKLLGVGRSVGYAAARAREIPTLRLGGRLLVPVPALLRLLGEIVETTVESGP